MCGIAGMVNLTGGPINNTERKSQVMGELLAHRGPDAEGFWCSSRQHIAMVHRRLSIIDLSSYANQPMSTKTTTVCFNGEIYNYRELASLLGDRWNFKTQSDTETILAAYQRYGENCLEHFRGMFAFALYDEIKDKVVFARDRFGIKPLYYTIIDDILYFASEAKALLPFVEKVETDENSLTEYLTFQFSLGDRTLFKGIKQLLPGHGMTIESGNIRIWKYWDVKFEIDYDHSEHYFIHRLQELMDESVSLHCRSDVEIGSYLSGGIDSSLIHILANQYGNSPKAFHGKFTGVSGYDESHYAQEVIKQSQGSLISSDIETQEFSNNIRNVIYHLDFPVAGPGAFAQYMISKVARKHVKVVLGGQGGDEIFGGYARYTIAYLEQCLKAAIDGSYKDGNYVVTIESIIPNLGILKEYKPLIKEFWRSGLFEAMDKRYFKLIDRSADVEDEIHWEYLKKDSVFERFAQIFNNPNNVKKNAYFDKMTHFDFKCFLPALLQVEDRMSMAHGLESRVPFLDHPLIEFSATIPADVKFKNGNMKHMLKQGYRHILPKSVVSRRDKMGFPVPLREWYAGSLKREIQGLLLSLIERNLPFINAGLDVEKLLNAPFSRKTWGLLSLELWYQTFHDRQEEYRNLLIK